MLLEIQSNLLNLILEEINYKIYFYRIFSFKTVRKKIDYFIHNIKIKSTTIETLKTIKLNTDGVHGNTPVIL